VAETRHDHRQGWTIDKGPGFLRGRLKQPLRDCMSARAVQRSIESELVEHGFQKVLFDMRHVDEHDDEVRRGVEVEENLRLRGFEWVRWRKKTSLKAAEG